MTNLLELAAAVERAEGPDRELDCEIAVTTNRRPGWLPVFRGQLWIDRSSHHAVVRFCDEGMKQSPGNPAVDEIPVFSHSIDAALMLVPDGWDYTLYSACGSIKPTAQLETEQMRQESVFTFVPIEGQGETLALALCAAALKARALSQGDNHADQ